MKKILTGKDARAKLLEAAKLMNDCVSITLSPKGRNVLLAREWANPIVVHDGVTVAREVESPDEFVNEGIKLIREAANRTNFEAGDGTTTSTLLAYHLVDGGMKLLNEGVNPMILRRQIDEALPRLVEEIKKISIKIGANDIQRVATISSQDPEIGRVVTEAIEKVGKDGLVSVEESATAETIVDYAEGMEFPEGYISEYLVTDPDRMEAVIQDPYIVIIDKQITIGEELVNMLNAIATKTKNVVIIGRITGNALATLVLNKRQGRMNILAVNPPFNGDFQKNSLEDIGILTGATVLSDQIGVDIQQFDLAWCGKAKTVTSTKSNTVIIGGLGGKEEIKIRVQQLKAQLKSTKSLYEKERLEERLARMTTGAAVIRVGTKTDTRLREDVERVKDAVGAAKSALAEGIVPGGGTTFMRLAHILRHDNDGNKLLYDVLREPLSKLLENAGKTEKEHQAIFGEVFDETISRQPNLGYNITTDKVEDLLKAGVVDPAKVIRLSLENAVEVAGSILSTDCLIVNETKKATNEAV